MTVPFDINLSSWSLGLTSPIVRRTNRLPTLRHPDFEDKYDFHTVFYDCFWEESHRHIQLIGPPLLNLEEELGLRFFAMPSGQECKPLVTARTFISQLRLAVPASCQFLQIESAAGTAILVPQPNLSSLFAGRRVLMTLSQNNELEWIRDWIVHHQKRHGCDAAIVYDNNSTRYDLSEVKACLSGISGITGLAVSWPFRYGPFDGRLPLTYDLWDGHYCQFGMLEHARHRFLTTARSSLNLDIDELVICQEGGSIFALTETAAQGYLKFSGKWVENHRSSGDDPASKPLHRDFWHRKAGRTQGCETKWAAVPSKVPLSAQFGVHEIFGYPESERSSLAEIRHFKALNTNWSVDRPGRLNKRTEADARADDLAPDVVLQGVLSSTFAGTAREAGAIRFSGPEAAACQARQLSARLASANRLAEAEAAARSALSAAPGRPSLILHLAAILARQGDEPGAAQARAQAAALQEREGISHYDRGRYLLHTGDYGQAAHCFRKAIRLNPGFAPAYHALGKLYWAEARPRSAEQFLRCGLSRLPSSGLLNQALAEVLQAKGRHGEALPFADAALAADPLNGQFTVFRSKLLRALGRKDEARQAAERAVELQSDNGLRLTQLHAAIEYPFLHPYPEPDSLAARLELIYALLEAGGIAAAQDLSQDTLMAFPNRPFPCEARYCVLETAGQHEAAQRCLADGIRLARRDLAVLPPQTLGRFKEREWYNSRAFYLSHLLFVAGEDAEAIQILSDAVSLYPDSHGTALRLIHLLIAYGRGAEAQDLLAKALLRFPRCGDLRLELGRMQEAAGDVNAAISSYRSAVHLGTRQAWLISHLAQLVFEKGDLAEAEGLLRRALLYHAADPLTHYRLGEVLERTGRREDAFAAWQKAAELAPQEAWLWSHLGGQLVEAGRLDEAEAALGRAAHLNATDMLTAFRMGRLWEARGDDLRARAHIAKAVSINGREPWLWRHYANLAERMGDAAEAGKARKRAAGLERPPAKKRVQRRG